MTSTTTTPIGGSDTPCTSRTVEFTGGTKRSSRRPIYHLIPKELMEAVALTRAEGDVKYEPGNWMRGDKEFFADCLSHAIDHLMECAWDERESLETHLGHAATNIGFMLWALKRGIITRRDLQEAALLGSGSTLHAQIQPK